MTAAFTVTNHQWEAWAKPAENLPFSIDLILAPTINIRFLSPCCEAIVEQRLCGACSTPVEPLPEKDEAYFLMFLKDSSLGTVEVQRQNLLAWVEEIFQARLGPLMGTLEAPVFAGAVEELCDLLTAFSDRRATWREGLRPSEYSKAERLLWEDIVRAGVRSGLMTYEQKFTLYERWLQLIGLQQKKLRL